MTRVHHPATHWVLLACLVTMWSTTYLSIKVALLGFDTLTVIAARLVLGSLVLLGIAAAAGSRLPRTRVEWGWMLWLALLGNCLPFFFITWGTQHIDSSLAGILVAVMPLGVLVLAHFALPGERITRRKAAGFVLGFAGVVVLIGPDALDLGNTSLLQVLGQLAVLGGALLYAANAVSARRMPRMDSISVALSTLLIATVLMVACAFWFEDPFAATPPPEAVWSVLWMGIFPTAVATIVYFQLIRMAGASFMALTNYLTPGISVLLGMVLLGERPGWNAFAGMILILAGVAIAQSALKRRQA
ncbi:MAG: DMT family transporter [Rhodocyclaceae bacterium]|nr:DMT family transporter [Rhodocyclaceae bacterium]